MIAVGEGMIRSWDSDWLEATVPGARDEKLITIGIVAILFLC